MADESKTIWGIHSYDDHLFLRQNRLGTGWNVMGGLNVITPARESFRERMESVAPDTKPGAVPMTVGMVYRFAVEMKEGNYVVLPSKGEALTEQRRT